MNKKESHIIRRQSVEISFENLNNSAGIQDRIAEIIFEKLLPEMNVLFDEIAADKYLISLNTLMIDSGYLSMNNWEQEFVNNTMHEIKTKLLSAHKKEYTREDNLHEAAAESFLFFLERGYLPWNSRFDSIKQLEAELQFESRLITELKDLMRHSDTACKRIVLQFSEDFRRKASAVLSGGEKEVFQIIKYLGDSLETTQMDKTVIDTGLIKASAFEWAEDMVGQFLEYVYSNAGKEALQSIQIILDNIIKINHAPAGKIAEGYLTLLDKMNEKVNEEYKTSKSNSINNETIQNTPKAMLHEAEYEIPRPEAETENTEENKIPDTIYINNAGLIILHQFLPEFFMNLKLTKENIWAGETARNKAAEILQFLVTGEGNNPEFNLPLNKIICGIDLDEVLKNTAVTDAEVKNECESLLKELIKHWSVLKNTGMEALRHTFLQRNGLITPADNGWLLKVEQKSVDLLLKKLPWGIGIIKLPWMKKILYAEWV